MAGRASDPVAKRIASLFGSPDDSDCSVVFCHMPQCETSAKRQRSEATTQPSASEAVTYGDPLPAHQLVLRSCSERFGSELRRWKEQGGSSDPVLRVPLGSEAEVAPVRLAIQYAYTGEVSAGTVQDVLKVRQQAAYLQIDGCASACCGRIRGMLAQGAGAAGEAAGGTSTTVSPHLLGLFASRALWPSGDSDFSALVASAKKMVVTHFGDALAVLNTPALYKQMLKLPAAALTVLLESDEFGTDSESSVLLMLAEWMTKNYGSTDAETRIGLCKLVRLVHLSRSYLTSVLPALAADRQTPPSSVGKASCAGWFPISVCEAGFIAGYVTAGATEREAMKAGAKGVYDVKTPWYSTSRRQCLPPRGRAFEWEISQEELAEVLQELEPDGWVDLCGSHNGSFEAYFANGFLWETVLLVTRTGTGSQLVLACRLPPVLAPWKGWVGPTRKIVAAPSINARMSVYYWENGTRKKETLRTPSHMSAGDEDGSWKALEHLLPVAEGGDPVEAWAAYLRSGKVSGVLELLPPPANA